MKAEKATELVPATEPASPELPPILVGRATPAVAAQVQDFYESVAQIFERWVTRRSSTAMATIRDKMGHWPSVPFRHDGEDWFAFSVETRTRRLRGRGSLVPGIHHKTSIDNVFCSLAVSCFGRAESEPGLGWPIDCELRTSAR